MQPLGARASRPLPRDARQVLPAAPQERAGRPRSQGDLRRQRMRRPEPQELGTESESTARQWVVTENHPLRLSLERTLRRLNPRHSSVLLKFEVEGLKHSEIAAVLRITEGASKTRLSQARRQSREMLSSKDS